MNTTLHTFQADLTDVLGARAPEALRLLRRRDGADQPEAWRREIEAWLEHTPGLPSWHPCARPAVAPVRGFDGRACVPPVWMRSESESVLLWLQHLRAEHGKPEVFSTSSLWRRAHGALSATLIGTLTEPGLLVLSGLTRQQAKTELARLKGEMAGTG
ncbi:MAG: hypothetical protein AAFX99_01975 [Myxococcota bacterium]